jgi:DNA-binding transcriptional MerR regulator
MSIGTFARRSRLSTKALRIYDRLGVLTPAAVDGHNGYRRYRESQLGTARLVVSLRRLDMPLAQVAEVVAASASDRAGLIDAFWREVEHRVAGQRSLKDHLLTRLSGQEGNYAMFTILERDVEEQTVLTEQRHLTVQGLPDFISGALGRLYGKAEELGVPAGSSMVIYHGEVNEDSDGPVEVCVPVQGDGDLSGQAHRIEPAHREAYTEITVAQVEFPQILSAYEAVERWVVDNGREITGSPREVYVDDFMNLGPDDHGCDIAFPIK